MPEISSNSDPSAFLEDARPFAGENKFTVGTFERGITFYRQQVRALNLVYSLIEARDNSGDAKISPGSRLTIIGGGAFGITAAAAAAYGGFQVTLLERQQNLLHLQRGCDTRWLHPRFYDWPAPESESRLARLPLLDWAASTAGDVAAELETEFFELVKDRGPALKCILDVSQLEISGPRNTIYEVHYRTGTDQHIIPCEAIIYAVGFGIEEGDNEPYWRNDRLGQDFTGASARYVVSGTGDGGLVDVFRLTIRDFRYERIFSEMFGPPDSPLLERLRTLQSSATNQEGWLYDQLSSIEGEHSAAFESALNLLRKRRRSDTEVTLNGLHNNLRQALTLEQIALSNALLVFCLYRIKAIEYQAGPYCDKPEWLKGKHPIIRHGTDREKALRDVDFDEKAIAFVKRQAEIRDSGKPIYPAGWWGRYVAPAEAARPGQSPVPIEFVPPALMTHATTFISTLGDILEYLINKESPGAEFRVAVHRLVRFDGVEFFQQVTPYVGQGANKGGIGRLFRVEGGIVGLACRTGSLVVAKRTNDEAFNKIWELTELQASGAKPIKPYVDSLFACPFFGPQKGNGPRVSLVLFCDSAQPDFFSPGVLEIISAACRGFVQLLETLLKVKALRPIPTYYSGYEVELTADLKKLVATLKGLGVKFVDASDQGWKEGLTFEALTSLDLEVGRTIKLASIR